MTTGEGLAKRTMVGLSVAVVSFGAIAWPIPARASADPISSTKAQVSALQAQVVASAARIRTLTLAYEEANTKASSLAQQVATDRAALATLQGRLDSTRSALRQEAILGYTGASATPPEVAPGAIRDLAVRAEYLQVASGDISNILDRYRTEQAQVATAESALAGELSASDAAAAAAGSARQLAISEATSVQNQLDNAQGRLSQLLAAQAAARAAAAAQAATQAAAANSNPPSQGLPVNGGLVSVVRNIVAPTPAPGPTVVATPAPTPAPPASSGGSSGASGGAGGVWLQLRQCESGDNYQENTGNGFYGAYQFSQSTWTGLGYPGRPDLEPPAMQDQAAQRLQAQSGWGQWPACSAALGLH